MLRGHPTRGVQCVANRGPKRTEIPVKKETVMKDTAKDARVPAIDRRDFVKLGVGAAGAGAMMAMGAPGAWPQNGANRPVSIDLHNHWRPLAYTKALEQ